MHGNIADFLQKMSNNNFLALVLITQSLMHISETQLWNQTQNTLFIITSYFVIITLL